MLKTPGAVAERQRAPQEAACDRLRSAEPARIDDDPPEIRRASRATLARGRSAKASRVRSR